MNWYKYDIRNLSDEKYSHWYSLMSDEKKKKVDKLHFTDDKKRSVAGEMLAKKAISLWCNTKVNEIQFATTKKGKPYAINHNVEFNISHCSNFVVCAVDNKRVGIDVQIIKPIDLKVAKHVFDKQQMIQLFNHKPTKSDFVQTEDEKLLNNFYQLWTQKESLGKYLGDGLFFKHNENVVNDYENECAIINDGVDDYAVNITYSK